MIQLPAIDVRTYAHAPAKKLRADFLVDGLFVSGEAIFKHWETDRTVIGGIVPGAKPIALPCPRGLAATYFHERRESGIVNLGDAGAIEADGTRYTMARYDCLYLGRGVKDVTFSSVSSRKPARFYVLSYPAHMAYPTQYAPLAATPGVKLGADATGNNRILYKFIHPGGIRSCQLVLGLTMIQAGSKWNTMPPHTHLRRSEVYLYFDLPAEGYVKHFVGHPGGIRHLRAANEQAVLSPPWSVHCGAGSIHYSFIWGMGGENQEFSDMDPVDAAEILDAKRHARPA